MSGLLVLLDWLMLIYSIKKGIKGNQSKCIFDIFGASIIVVSTVILLRTVVLAVPRTKLLLSKGGFGPTLTLK